MKKKDLQYELQNKIKEKGVQGALVPHERLCSTEREYYKMLRLSTENYAGW